MRQNYAITGLDREIRVEYRSPVGTTNVTIPVGSGISRTTPLSEIEFMGYVEPFVTLCERGELSEETFRAMMDDVGSCMGLVRFNMIGEFRRMLSEEGQNGR